MLRGVMSKALHRGGLHFTVTILIAPLVFVFVLLFAWIIGAAGSPVILGSSGSVQVGEVANSIDGSVQMITHLTLAIFAAAAFLAKEMRGPSLGTTKAFLALTLLFAAVSLGIGINIRFQLSSILATGVEDFVFLVTLISRQATVLLVTFSFACAALFSHLKAFS